VEQKRNPDCRLKTENLKSQIFNPQFPMPTFDSLPNQ